MDSKNAFAYIQKCIEKHTNFDYSKIFLNSIVDDFKKISGAFSVAYNELSHCSENTITKAVSNSEDTIMKISRVTGFNIVGKSYTMDPVVNDAVKSDQFVMYRSLSEISRHQIPEQLSRVLEKLFSIDRVYILGLKLGDEILGNLVFIMRKDKDIENVEVLRLYAKHFALLISQYKKYKNSFINIIDEHETSRGHPSEISRTIIALLENSPDLVYHLDEKGNFIFINQTIMKYGYNPQELLGRNVLDIVHPEDRKRTHWMLMERRSGKRRTTRAELRIITKEQSPVHLDINDTNFSNIVMNLDSEGVYKNNETERTFIGTIGLCRDVTETKRLESELIKKDKILKFITENINDAIWLEQIFPPRRLYSSNSVSDLFDQSVYINEENPRGFLSNVHPEDKQKVKEFIDYKLSLNQFNEIEYRYFHSANNYKWINSKTFPIKDADGNVNLLLGIARDITPQKATEKSFITRIEQEQLINKEANHRIKNNLFMIENIIDMEINACKDGEESASVKLANIKARIASIKLLHEMLYKNEDSSNDSLNGYLKSICYSISQISSVNKKKTLFNYNFDSEYRVPVSIMIPIGMITSELVMNALKYSSSTNTDDIVDIIFRKTKPNSFLLQITDNGKPFPSDIKEKIFPDRLGFKLINALASQLHGDFSFGTENGIKYCRINFESSEIRKTNEINQQDS